METLLPPTTEMKVVDFYHQKLCFEFVGAQMILDKLEKLQEQFPKLGGVALAVESAKAEISSMRASMLTRNVTVAMKHGFDLEGKQLAMELRKDGIYLRAIDQGEEVE